MIFNKLNHKFQDLISNITIKKIHTKSYVIAYESQTPNGMFLKDKYREKFNVLVYYPISTNKYFKYIEI